MYGEEKQNTSWVTGEWNGCEVDHNIIIFMEGIGFLTANEGREFDTGSRLEKNNKCKVFQPILTQSHYKINHEIFVDSLANYFVEIPRERQEFQ